MPTHLTLANHVTAIAGSARVLRDAAQRAGLDAAVPTCPEWTVADLVAHQGMVHRWAAANLRGDREHRTDDSIAEAAAAPDIFAWFSGGVEALLDTIAATRDDAEALVFLKDAPPPRRFWARRQAQETTVHSVDAIAAALGRWPTAAELDITPDLAADGIDELLCGFVPRRRSELRTSEPVTLCIETSDTGHAWTLLISDEPVRASTGPITAPDARLSGTAVQLYVGLWNRGDEMTASGRDEVLSQWREQVRVRWS